jgi:hypothetical protein
VIKEYEKGVVAAFTIPWKTLIKENIKNESKKADTPISDPASANINASDIFLLY